MSVDVQGYLESKGMRLKHAGRDEVNVPCFYHNEPTNKRGRLYVNVDPEAEIPGLHLCHVCGERGSLNKIRRHFGDPVSKVDKGTTHYEVNAAAASYYHEQLKQAQPAIDYLIHKRGLTGDTIKHFKLGWADGKLAEHLRSRGFEQQDIVNSGLVYSSGIDFFNGVIIIPYMIGKTVLGLRQKDLNGKYKQPQGWTQRLFNQEVVYGDPKPKEIIVTEGEFDCMVAHQLGFTAVGCPGTTQWKEDWNDLFDGIRRVYIAFDNDDAGRTGAEKIKEVFDRVRVVSLVPDDHEDTNDGYDLSDFYLDGAGPSMLKDKLTSSSGTLLVTVEQAFEEWSGLQDQDGLKFNDELLDRILAPGLLPGQVCVPLASTGTGKTLTTLNIFQRMAMHPNQQDIKILFVSLEQTRGDWAERAMRIFAYYNLGLAPETDKPEEIERFRRDIKQETVNWWSDRLMIIDKNRITEEDLIGAIDDFEDTMGSKPDLMAVDYLGYYARGVTGRDHFEKTSNAIMSIKAVAKETRMPVITPSQVNRNVELGSEPDINMARSSGVVEETADFVFGLWATDRAKDRDPEEATGQIHLRIGKSRHGGTGQLLRYRFSPMTLALVPINDQAATMALAELDFPRDSWELAMWRHRTGQRF